MELGAGISLAPRWSADGTRLAFCGASGTRDVIDASIVLCARRRGHGVVTSDAGDLRRLDPDLRYVEV